MFNQLPKVSSNLKSVGEQSRKNLTYGYILFNIIYIMRTDMVVPVDLQSLRSIQRKLLKYLTIQVYQTFLQFIPMLLLSTDYRNQLIYGNSVLLTLN